MCCFEYCFLAIAGDLWHRCSCSSAVLAHLMVPLCFAQDGVCCGCCCRHQAEAGRLRSELDAAHQKAAADMATVRQEAAEQVAAAETRSRK